MHDARCQENGSMLAVLACFGVALALFTFTCAVTSRHPERLHRNPLA